MPALIPITSTPQKISGTASKPYLISNDPSSLSTIYLGQDSSVSPYNYGVKLQAGGSLTWTEITKEVWALTDTNGSAKVSVMYEASATFSSQISTNSQSNAVLLAQQSINVQTSGASLPAQTIYLDAINILPYTSIKAMVSVTVNNTGGVTTQNISLNQNAYVQLSFVQANQTSGANLSPTNEAIFPLGNNSALASGNPVGLQSSIASYEFPVSNGFLAGVAGTNGTYIKVSSGTSTQASLTVTVRIFGTSNILQSEKYYNSAQGGFPTALGTFTYPQWGVMGSIGTSGVSYEIPSQNGRATLSVTNNSTATTQLYGQLQYFTRDFLSAWAGVIGTVNIELLTTQYANKTQEFIFPNLPVRLVTVATGGSGSWSIIQEKR